MLMTLIFAMILILLSLIGLSIGLILTGKPKLRKGCSPQNAQKEECKKKSCGVCDPGKTKKS